MIVKIFYSWQSDLPNKTNRSFIERALENAAKELAGDNSLEVEPVIDRDTAGVAGAPDIFSTILRKIDESQIFVCDVSIVTPTRSDRPSPNPNVLLELGYATKSLGADRLLIILNSAFGGPELLPFDLKMKRVIQYHVTTESETQPERKRLQSMLSNGIRTILELPLVSAAASLTEKDPVVKMAVNSVSHDGSGWSMTLTLHNIGGSSAIGIKTFFNGTQIYELDSLDAHTQHQRKIQLLGIKEGSSASYEVSYRSVDGSRYTVFIPCKTEQWWEPHQIKTIMKNGKTIEYS